jgi:hypothetical protein
LSIAPQVGVDRQSAIPWGWASVFPICIAFVAGCPQGAGVWTDGDKTDWNRVGWSEPPIRPRLAPANTAFVPARL